MIMKKNSFLGMIGVFVMLHTTAVAKQATVMMPQVGTQVVSVEPGDTLTYLDFKGYGKMTATTANSAYATTIFRPAQEGYTIYIDFDTVHVSQIANNAPTCLKVYNGVFDTLSVTYPADYEGVPKTVFPHTAAQLDSLTLTQTYGGMFRHKTYLSTDATGALSCCFSSCAKVVSFGWNAKVYALPNRPQKATSAVPDYSRVATSVYGGEKNISLAAFALSVDGAAPVDTLTSVQFTLTDKTVFDPAQIALYVGNAERTLLPTASNPYINIRSKVETTFSETNGVYTLTMKQPLELADNLFCFGGDVLTNAPWDGLSTLTITGVSTKQGAVAVAGSMPVAQKVLPTVCLEGGQDKTVDVDRSDIRFYDNGGAENKYTNAASAGTVLFRPTTAGNRVMLDFQSIAINSRDTLCVYSGSMIDEANLLYTGKNGDKNIRIKSLSADGVLTVRFATKSTDNSVSSYNGWEATPSEFVPAPMVIASSAVSKEKATPVCGTKDVQVLHFVLNAENTENALAPVSFRFNTGNTYNTIDHAKLYYTGNSSKFSTTNMVAEADINADEFTLTTTAMAAFREGEQHFFVVADIAEAAATDDPVDINIVEVAFADNTVYNSFNNPTSGIKVLNSITSVCDEHSYSISGKWQFTHTVAKASEYPAVVGGYAMDMCDQITTFVPATTGAKIHIEFSLFDIFYANDMYGFDTSTAMFVVYNGSSTDGDVLFEVNSLATATTLPEAITSTAEDGALTVLFNANPSYMGYTNAGGWKATVSEKGKSSAIDVVEREGNAVIKYLNEEGQLRIVRDGKVYDATGKLVR